MVRGLKRNLFEVESTRKQAKFLVKVYDMDEAFKFQNEVEKLILIGKMMDEIGIKE